MNDINSIVYLSDDKIEISPSFKLRYQQLQSSSGRALCLVDILLKNNGAIAANYPFLCITSLGLNVVAATGWTQSDIKLIRKMKRFTPLKNNTLESQTEAHCCTIALRYKFQSAKCLEFEPGSDHPLSELSNLNLVCAVGAGNYPSKRVLLQVPATAFKTIIEEQEEIGATTHIIHSSEVSKLISSLS